ncbi:hypothetical protein LWI29_030047 [Acer saccharum]|uniref:Uncharacterized protein n=1 Tax=Acer saccharum TaxID=4024 RepID=A0AA39T9B7_ACESA|nr:hypothetical protein LWI29_030047 [Acer saccharum]
MISEINALEDDTAWWIDSSATRHVCMDRSLFTTNEKVDDGNILYMGNSSTATIEGKGNVRIEFTSGKILTLTDGYINFSFCYPGSEVPKWFRYTTEGSSIKFQKTFDCNLKGFAVCAIIAFEEYLFNGDNKHKLGVHFDCPCSDGDQSSPTNIMSETAYFASRNRTLIDSDHVAFGYCYASNRSLFERQLKNYSFEFRLSEESPNCRVKSCGVCPIYYKDSDADDSDEAGTSGSRFDEEEMEPHGKENENLQAVKYAEPIEHIGETSGINI